jgi:cytochrome c-type biogenesis protein CcmE
MMAVSVRPEATQIAVLEGRNLIEHYVSRPADDVAQIHGNIYLGKVQNVLPGMEAAFVDIATPKNAVLYRGVAPDTFTDGVDVVVEGRLDRNGTFQATTLLAKCASRYENAPDKYQQTPGYQQGTPAPRA